MPDKSTNRISSELRKIENEVDNYYKENLLLRLDFASAAWQLLAVNEDLSFMTMLKIASPSLHNIRNLAENSIWPLKVSLFWLFSSYSGLGEINNKYITQNYKAAMDLLELGEAYLGFEAAFTYASRGEIDIKLDKFTILPEYDFSKDSEYEAYNHLLTSPAEIPNIQPEKLDDLLKPIEKNIRIKSERFSYKLDPKLVAKMMDFLTPVYDEEFLLPDNWQFPKYSLKDFKAVFKSIAAIAFIQSYARSYAARHGCGGMGFSDSILLINWDELNSRVSRYSGVKKEIVFQILNDLTYGNSGITSPDPAIQPLIKLDSQKYAIAPSIWQSLAPERNFAVLLNKLDHERKSYSLLVEGKEEILRQRIKSSLSSIDLRFVHGFLSDKSLPDIDLAIISDNEKACILIELKWFISPAEIREKSQRSEELTKGVSQALKLHDLLLNNSQHIMNKLKTDSSYQYINIVGSANWIGLNDVQNPNIPIINVNHLTEKIKHSNDLHEVIKWLTERRYLPRNGTHYQIIDLMHQISSWSVKWYGIQALITEPFFPL